jgi:hypothetical protein
MGHAKALKWLVSAFMGYIILACSATKNYDRAYRRAWRKIVNSQAWRDALITDYGTYTAEGDVYYPQRPVPSYNEQAGSTEANIDEVFLEKYRSLVLRAYFRTIAEAEQADARIYKAYADLRSQRKQKAHRDDPVFREKLENARIRYKAHREMLEGLKSWKAFNEYGSDDLDFFLSENLPRAHSMHSNGRGDEEILRYLVYRLADLYHFEEN